MHSDMKFAVFFDLEMIACRSRYDRKHTGCTCKNETEAKKKRGEVFNKATVIGDLLIYRRRGYLCTGSQHVTRGSKQCGDYAADADTEGALRMEIHAGTSLPTVHAPGSSPTICATGSDPAINWWNMIHVGATCCHCTAVL